MRVYKNPKRARNQFLAHVARIESEIVNRKYNHGIFKRRADYLTSISNEEKANYYNDKASRELEIVLILEEFV